ncbi:MAG: tRNA (adenosine(37)-N6)-threonylcarbamoyltransferase complex ATPase subunit type 1 TsaE [Ardenticatenia bacterium]|nr:tRNA (adenosine(37)-N6)-threonylcarbamoyltransferase complex ATPase subunit type 1 TsaE [Ardenticatenia bacterium]
MNVRRKSDNTLSVLTRSPAATRRLGFLVGRLAQPGHVVLLSGPLGVGKTLFVQGVAAGLGIPDVVRSPSFTLINEYHTGRLPLYHVDLYRLTGADELTTIGLEEYLERHDGVIAVEWPERAAGQLPTEALHVRLESTEEGEEVRLIRVEAVGVDYRALLEAIWGELTAASVKAVGTPSRGEEGAVGH